MAIKRYGVPYTGSKNKIAAWVVENLPPARFFIDAFAGGCAVTHAALLSGKYERLIANDLSPAPDLFLDAVHGKFANETRWISREDFFALKDTDAYVRYCWSFGTKGDTYLYGRPIEPYKKACWYAIMFDDFSLLRELCPETAGAVIDALDGMTETAARRGALDVTIRKFLREHVTDDELFQRNRIYDSLKIKVTTKRQRAGEIKSRGFNQSLERLEGLQRLVSLERLEGLQRLHVTHLDYQSVFIPADSVIYCDPPYCGTTNEYGHGVDYESFYQWCERQKNLVVISEYSMPEPRFVSVAQKEKRKTLAAVDNQSIAIEHLYVPRNQEALYYDMMGKASADEFYKRMGASE